MVKTLILFIFFIGSIPIFGQQVVASGGQSGSSNDLQASATIGEAIIGSATNADVVSNQGFQQPLAKDLTSIIEISPSLSVEFNLGPNPMTNTLNVFLSDPLECQVIVMDKKGMVISKINMGQGEVRKQIDVSQWISGAYFVQVKDLKGRHLTALPIIKI